MGRVYSGASTSIDGYVSGPDFSGFEHLFKWFNSGDVEVAGMRTSQASADYYGALLANTGAGVVGRTLYDHTNGWGWDVSGRVAHGGVDASAVGGQRALHVLQRRY